MHIGVQSSCLNECVRLSELLCLPLPDLPNNARKTDSLQIGVSSSNNPGGEESDEIYTTGGKWEDDEERKFFEEVQDLRDFVPKSVLGLDDADKATDDDSEKAVEQEKELRKLDEELQRLGGEDGISENTHSMDEEDECVIFSPVSEVANMLEIVLLHLHQERPESLVHLPLRTLLLRGHLSCSQRSSRAFQTQRIAHSLIKLLLNSYF